MKLFCVNLLDGNPARFKDPLLDVDRGIGTGASRTVNRFLLAMGKPGGSDFGRTGVLHEE